MHLCRWLSLHLSRQGCPLPCPHSPVSSAGQDYSLTCAGMIGPRLLLRPPRSVAPRSLTPAGSSHSACVPPSSLGPNSSDSGPSLSVRMHEPHSPFFSELRTHHLVLWPLFCPCHSVLGTRKLQSWPRLATLSSPHPAAGPTCNSRAKQIQSRNSPSSRSPHQKIGLPPLLCLYGRAWDSLTQSLALSESQRPQFTLPPSPNNGCDPSHQSCVPSLLISFSSVPFFLKNISIAFKEREGWGWGAGERDTSM